MQNECWSNPEGWREEFGHLIDHQAFEKGVYASLDPQSLLREVMAAIYASNAVADLRSLRRALTVQTFKGPETADRGFINGYLLNPDELFARAYRQWVGIHSGDPEILHQIGQRQNTRGYEIGYNIKWEDRDFEPISIEMEKVFNELG